MERQTLCSIYVLSLFTMFYFLLVVCVIAFNIWTLTFTARRDIVVGQPMVFGDNDNWTLRWHGLAWRIVPSGSGLLLLFYILSPLMATTVPGWLVSSAELLVQWLRCGSDSERASERAERSD